MALRGRIAAWLHPATYLGGNAVTLAGAVLTSSAALTMLGVWLLEVASGHPLHPYAGLVVFVALPVLFVLGLLLMPVGVLVHRRRRRRLGQPIDSPTLDIRNPVVARALTLVALLTIVNVALLGAVTSKSVEVMDSNAFCGTTCHRVMEPEYTAFQHSSHERVGCVGCHVGPGAAGFFRAKLAGARQLLEVTVTHFPTPIPPPGSRLVAARDTCETCHRADQTLGARMKVIDTFAEDEANTRSTTVLMLKVGGPGSGIHGRHTDPTHPISYVTTDGPRQTISHVTWVDDAGKTVEFVTEDAKAKAAPGERRTMDCTDCHNRRGHAFQLPERALDEALAAGQVSVRLPFVKQQALVLLKRGYADRAEAETAIQSGLTNFYRARYADIATARPGEIDAAVAGVQAVYARNVFPAMKVTWGTYPDNLGHQDFPGCFRCHDGSHTAPGGRAISQDCDTCHTVVAMQEERPKILTDLGVRPAVR
jgi:hypothetical protein